MTYRRLCLTSLRLPLLIALMVPVAAFSIGAKLAKAKVPEIVSNVDTSGGTPDATQVKTLQDISDAGEKTAKEWYSKIVDLIGAQKHPQPDKVSISYTYAYKGVAATGGDHTEVSNAYALRRPDDIPGVIVHELTHVVQHYTKDTGYDTGWLTEGIADYVRWFNFEPVAKRPHPKQSRNPKATGSYQTTAAFLFWAVNKYDKNLVKELNEAMYDGSYKPEIWTKLTGKSLPDLNTEWVATLEP